MTRPMHPARAAVHETDTDTRIAEATVRFLGSMRFIKIQTAFVAFWILCNATGFLFRWDVFPFILLNLLFSTQAAYAAPLILLAGNSQAERDARRDNVEAAEVESLLTMSTRQLDVLAKQDQVLAQQTEILDLLRPPIADTSGGTS